MRRPFRWNDPNNRCYGCSPTNERGLRLQFFETEDGIETDYSAPDHLEGAPGILHGGIQATLLDEVLCVAAHARHGCHVVTGELTVRYRRPVPTNTPLLVRGRVVEERDRSFLVEGTIQLAGDGEELTRARARVFRAPVQMGR